VGGTTADGDGARPRGVEAPVSESPERADPDRILVVLPNWVGDLVLATPALRAIRERFKRTHLTGLVRRPLDEVLAGGDWLDDLLYWPTGRSRRRRRRGFLGLAGQLRRYRFDMALLLANSFRSAMLVRLAGIPRRVGYDREARGMLLTDRLLPYKFDGKYVPSPMIGYYNAIARYVGCRQCSDRTELFTTAEHEAVASDAVAAAGVAPDQPLVVINPGASFGPAKCWLPERFAEVADRLADEFQAAVFIACGPKEVEVARRVAGFMAQPATVLDSPVMRLGPLKALIRRASLVITNDTGPRHFANAFGRPVVTVFGPTDPQWTLTPAPAERSIRVSVDCGPCMKRICPRDHRCMTRVESEAVWAAARELLAARAATGPGDDGKAALKPVPGNEGPSFG